MQSDFLNLLRISKIFEFYHFSCMRHDASVNVADEDMFYAVISI